jgi:prepilin peptidase CpaA
MPLTDIVRFAVAVIATGVLAWAAISDWRTRRIPNASVLALLALFVPWAAADGGAGLVSALEAAGIALALSVGLYLFKIVGAGDSKLFTVCALFAGMGYLPYLALATSLVGGAIAVISIGSRPRRALVMATLGGKGDWGRGVPYGVAVAAGAAMVIWACLTGVFDPFAYFGRAPVTAHALSRALAGHVGPP